VVIWRFDQKDHPVAQLVRRDHIVRREKHRCAAVTSFADHLADPARGDRVETRGRFVQKQEPRSMQKRARDCQTAAHTFRDLCDELVAVLFQPDAFQQRARILCAAAVQPSEELEVFPCSQLQIVVRGFERDANSTVVAPIPGAQILAQDGDIALIAIQQPYQNVLCRALAGTARAKETEDLARLHREGDVANGRPLGAGIRQAERVNVDNGHVRGTVAALACSEMHDLEPTSSSRATLTSDGSSVRA
jgi:hypothetical protein